MSEEFLEEVKALPYKNVAVELLQAALNNYHNRAIDTLEIIEELIQLAQDIKVADERGEALGLDINEECFYDALANSESAIDLMGDLKRRCIKAF
jgi:type I restriction enzyme R subunit